MRIKNSAPANVTRLPLNRPRRASHPAPSHLEPAEQGLWDRIHAAFSVDDAASVALLTTALESHQRARRCRERIDADGETVRDRFGQLRPHPLLQAERDARNGWLASVRALNLDLGT